MVLRRAITTFFFGCTSGEGNHRFHFKVVLDLSDWPQHQKVFSVKGHAGSILCHCCINVVGRCEYFEDDSGLVHFHSHEYEKMKSHTVETFRETAAHVEHSKDEADIRIGKVAAVGRHDL